MMTLAADLPLFRRARNAYHTARHRLRYRLERYGRAWRYARAAMTSEDAHQFIYEAEHAAGHYSLAWFTVDELKEAAAERWGDMPEMAQWASDAAARVSGKWSGEGGELAGAAVDWALSLIPDYAAQDGVKLVEIDADTDEQEV